MTSVSKLRRPIVVCVGLLLVAVIGCAPKPPSRAALVRSALTWAEERAIAARDPRLMADAAAGWAAVDRRHSEEIFARARQAALEQGKEAPTAPAPCLRYVAIVHAQARPAQGAVILREALADLDLIVARSRAMLQGSSVMTCLDDRVGLLEALAEFAPKDAEFRASQLPGRYGTSAFARVKLGGMMRPLGGGTKALPPADGLQPASWGLYLAPGSAYSLPHTAPLIDDAVRRQIARGWDDTLRRIRQLPDADQRAWCWIVVAHNVSGQRRAFALHQAADVMSAAATRCVENYERAQARADTAGARLQRIWARQSAELDRIARPVGSGTAAQWAAWRDRCSAVQQKYAPALDPVIAEASSAGRVLGAAICDFRCLSRASQWALLATITPPGDAARARLVDVELGRFRRPVAIPTRVPGDPGYRLETGHVGVKERAVVMAAASFVNPRQAVSLFRTLVAARGTRANEKEADAAIACAAYLIARIDPELVITTYDHGFRAEDHLVADATALLEMGDRATAAKLLAAAEKRYAKRIDGKARPPRDSDARRDLDFRTQAIALGRARWGDGGQALQLAFTIGSRDVAVETVLEIAEILRHPTAEPQDPFEQVWEVCSAMDLAGEVRDRELPWTH